MNWCTDQAINHTTDRPSDRQLVDQQLVDQHLVNQQLVDQPTSSWSTRVSFLNLRKGTR